jgi:two-component system sensor histidine kinase GlrK
VSHELRTPLSKIREALALLSDGAVGELDTRQARVVQIARIACEREIRMVTTLLDLSRLRTGSPLRLTNGASLEAVVQSAVADERAEAISNGVTLDVKLALDGRRCRLDPVLMERAIANLVRNAVAVSKRGQRVDVICEVVASETERAVPTFRLRVRDEGPGVPLAIRATVFDAFVTHEVPTSGKAIGVGIGLALAREVARAHGGDLCLLEEVEAGACFEMWLPIDDSPIDPRPVRRSLGLASMHSFEIES